MGICVSCNWPLVGSRQSLCEQSGCTLQGVVQQSRGCPQFALVYRVLLWLRCKIWIKYWTHLQCREDADAACLRVGRDVLQALANAVFSLPSRPDKAGRLVDLPPPTTPLPREKPVRNPCFLFWTARVFIVGRRADLYPDKSRIGVPPWHVRPQDGLQSAPQEPLSMGTQLAQQAGPFSCPSLLCTAAQAPPAHQVGEVCPDQGDCEEEAQPAGIGRCYGRVQATVRLPARQ